MLRSFKVSGFKFYSKSTLNELIDRFAMQDLPEDGLEEIDLEEFALGLEPRWNPNQPLIHRTLDEDVFNRLANAS